MRVFIFPHDLKVGTLGFEHEGQNRSNPKGAVYRITSVSVSGDGVYRVRIKWLCGHHRNGYEPETFGAGAFERDSVIESEAELNDLILSDGGCNGS